MYNVAGELCKLARVTGPEFPPPLLSRRTLPASDWPVPRGGIKDNACPVSVCIVPNMLLASEDIKQKQNEERFLKSAGQPHLLSQVYMLKSVLLFP